MSTIGPGYGSEWHLLRYLGYHRNYLKKQIFTVIKGEELTWCDFHFSHKNEPFSRDTDRSGLDFIEDPDILRCWHAFWPTTGRAQNWDAVGKIKMTDGTEEWLLIEAKAHNQEVKSSVCKAGHRSRKKIEKALEKTKAACGAGSTPLENWLGPYYQYANRLAALYFLMEECQPAVPARLLFIYFLGDKHEGKECPQTREDWDSSLDETENVLGIDCQSPLYERVHHLFLDVNPKAKMD